MSKVLRRRDDEGASLILVLVFVASFAIIVPALLTQAETNVSSVKFTQDVAAASLDADAAAESAINDLRNGSFSNAPAQPCFHDPADLVGTTDSNTRVLTAGSAGTNSKRDVLVTCSAKDSTGYATSIVVPINSQNRPGQALLTLSDSATGITHDKNNVLRIQGGVYSNSGITVANNNAELEVTNAALIAEGTCSGPITAEPKSCNDTSQQAKGADPNYALPVSPPAQAVAPGCSGATGVSLSPGTYTSAAALENLTNSCKALLHFQPGTYYFDFNAADRVWNITEGYVVGGTIPAAPGRTWSLAGYPTNPPKIPGACVAPTESQSNGGVQFIFGGQSRMVISGGGKAEICGQYSVSRPPLAVFGANDGAAGVPINRAVTTASATSSGNPSFSQAGRVVTKDGSTADTLIFGQNTNKATATLTAAMPSPTIPAGSILQSASLRITHGEGGTAHSQGGTTYAAGAPAVEVAFLPSSRINAAATFRVPAAQPTLVAALHDDVLDITNELKADFEARGFSGLTTTFAASIPAGQAARAGIDVISLDLTYSMPGFTTTKNACAGAPCTIIEANGSQPTTQLYIQGTTYTPFSRLDVTLNNVSAQVFRFGLIGDTVRVALTGSSTFADAVISVPNESPGSATGLYVPPLVTLQVYVCAVTSCAEPPAGADQGYVPSDPNWKRQLSTQVVLKDTAFPPLPNGQRPVGIVSWYHPATGS